MESSILLNISTVDTTKLYILYVINLKNDYKKQIVFYNLNSAKHMKKQIQSSLHLGGQDVFVNKVLGFYDDEGYIHCLNGFKYSLVQLEENEHKYSTKDISSLVSKLHQHFPEKDNSNESE
jgi:hypothetical protein